MKLSFLKRLVLPAVIFLLCAAGISASGSKSQDHEYLRAKVLAFVLRQNLAKLHFNHKKIDDTLSKEAFSQYLKNLDGQKLLLLKEDVKKLSEYSDLMDDEINKGTFELPVLAGEILARRAASAQKIVSDILAKDFDFSVKEYYETDPKKIEYCDTEKDLRERWRKYLKLQVLQQYLTLREDAASQAKDEERETVPGHLQQTARQRVLRGHEVFLSRIRQQNERENFDRFFNTIARTFDPHTEYMPPATKEDFDIGMRGTLEGIGAALREEDGYIKVSSVVPGSPAARQGHLHAEDIILKVGEKDKELVDITYMSIREAVKLIRGKKGTEVSLQIKKPDGSQIVVSIVRDVIKLEDSFVKGSTLIDKKSGLTFGYIKIPSFYRDFEKRGDGGSGRNSTHDVLNELRKPEMRKISGLILDLRNNGGGALTDAVKTAGLFIKTGPVVQVKGSDGTISVLSDDDPGIAYTGPIIVLVNKFSASASEILAGALQDYGRAIIMGGEHTHGKGTVQTLIDLNNFFAYHEAGGDVKKDESLGALKLTTQKFYRITGESTQYRGITPDIVLPDQYQGLKSGEQFLDFALPWDTVQPVPYLKWKNPAADFPELKVRSEKRVSAEKDFVEIVEENRELIEKQKKTLRTLNLEEAVKERKMLSELTLKHKIKASKEKDAGRDSSDLSEDGRRKIWLKEVRKDPYILEGMAVLTDVVTKRSALSLN